jgi:enolase-phosphatase E1
VTETLFPYARTHLRAFLEHDGRGAETDRFLALMDQDSKDGELKALQGRIWDEGYRDGALAGQVFDDVPRAFARWRGAGVPIGIYSSGSVLAQQLLFRTIPSGDLTSLISWYFDTSIGAKREIGSYTHIAERVGVLASGITFVSDVVAELDAARAAGMETVLSVRRGNAPQPPSDHRTITSFDQLR